MSESAFACPATCAYAGKPWPTSKGKPTCRLVADYAAATNPVTRASLRAAIRRRLGWMAETRPIPCAEDAPTPPARRLDELRDIPDLHDQHREALARIPKPVAPDDRL